MNNQQQGPQVGIRINGSMMKQYAGQYVTLIGKLLSCEGTNVVHVEACDDVTVQCTITEGNQDFQTCEGIIVELKGVVDERGHLNVQIYYGFNDVTTDEGKVISFDLSAYNNLLKLAHGPFKSMFDPNSVAQS